MVGLSLERPFKIKLTPQYGNYEASKQVSKCARVPVPFECYPSRITPISGVKVLYIVSIVKLKNYVLLGWEHNE